MRAFALLLSLAAAVILSSCSGENLPCHRAECADFTLHRQAQDVFESDPDCYAHLDQDGDGAACEEPGNTITFCDDFPDCGCEYKLKRTCRDDPCCRWYDGVGCGCK